MEEKTGDKIFIEKEGKIRFIVDQIIGLTRVLDQLRKRFKVNLFLDQYDNENIFLIEPKDTKD